MNLSSETSGALEAALDEFEVQWLQGEAPPDVVTAVTALHQNSGFAEQRIAWELAMSDLELRWRHGDPALRLGSRWYAEHLGSFGFSSRDLEELSAHELVVRSRWGDRPTIDSLLDEQFPGLDGEARRRHLQRYVRQLETHFPVACIVKVDGGGRFRTEVPTPCVLGRRRPQDPPSGKLFHDSATGQWRMIIVERDQNRISRNQALIRRVAVHQISVEALSKLVGCYLDQQRLPLDQPTVLEFTSRSRELRFQNVGVRFFPG